MMWLNGDILQVYWNGYHHVAAYLGNILVWRENIRATQSTLYVVVETPIPSANLCLGISAKATEKLNKILSTSVPNIDISTSAVSKISENVKSYGDAYTRSAKFPQSNLIISNTLGLANILSVLAQNSSSEIDADITLFGEVFSDLSIPSNSVLDNSTITDNNSAHARSSQLNTVEFTEHILPDNTSNANGRPTSKGQIDNLEKPESESNPIEKTPTRLKISYNQETPNTELVIGKSIIPLLGESISTELNTQKNVTGTLTLPISIDNMELVELANIEATAELYPNEDYDIRASQYINGTIKTIYAEDWEGDFSKVYRLFNNDSTIEEMHFPDTWTKLPPQFFWNPKGNITTTIYFPSSITTVDATSGFNGSFKRFTMDFTKCTKVPKCTSTSNSWSGVSKIVVPSSLLDTWKTYSDWSNLASKIVSN